MQKCYDTIILGMLKICHNFKSLRKLCYQKCQLQNHLNFPSSSIEEEFYQAIGLKN
jgi:hypothetical protein